MTVEFLRKFLAWCSLANLLVLTLWWLFFVFGRDWMYRLHGRWFKISGNTFDAIHYSAMAAFKLGIFLFNLVPYLVLRFIA